MILVVGFEADSTIAVVLARLHARNLDYALLDPRAVQNGCDIRLRVRSGRPEGSICLNGREIPFTEIESVFSRLGLIQLSPQDIGLPAGTEPGDVSFVYASRQEMLTRVLDILDCTVVNRPMLGMSNHSKGVQVLLGQRYGFETPTSLVSNDPRAVSDFLSAHPGAIVKSSSGIRSKVRPARDVGSGPSGLGLCPALFQERVRGADVRVHVVGARAFAVRLQTEAVDYRYAHEAGHSVTASRYELPAAVEERCITMTCDEGLYLSGIDFKVDADGRFFFLELNPSPAFLMFEQLASVPICDALIDTLVGVG